jgi:hypothetical protein
VGDTGHHRIVEFTVKWRFVTRWGGRVFSDPEGVAAAPSDRLMIVDSARNRVYKCAQS